MSSLEPCRSCCCWEPCFCHSCSKSLNDDALLTDLYPNSSETFPLCFFTGVFCSSQIGSFTVLFPMPTRLLTHTHTHTYILCELIFSFCLAPSASVFLDLLSFKVRWQHCLVRIFPLIPLLFPRLKLDDSQLNSSSVSFKNFYLSFGGPLPAFPCVELSLDLSAKLSQSLEPSPFWFSTYTRHSVNVFE